MHSKKAGVAEERRAVLGAATHPGIIRGNRGKRLPSRGEWPLTPARAERTYLSVGESARYQLTPYRYRNLTVGTDERPR